MNKVFLDTSYAVALSAPTDENHKRAAELADELERQVRSSLLPEPSFLKLECTLEGTSQIGGYTTTHGSGK